MPLVARAISISPKIDIDIRFLSLLLLFLLLLPLRRELVRSALFSCPSLTATQQIARFWLPCTYLMNMRGKGSEGIHIKQYAAATIHRTVSCRVFHNPPSSSTVPSPAAGVSSHFVSIIEKDHLLLRWRRLVRES